MRLLSVIGTLRMGGAERSLTGLADALARRGHDVTIVDLMPPGEMPFWPMAPDVGHVPIDCIGAGDRIDYPRAISRLRRVIRERSPELVLGFTTLGNLLAATANAGIGIPLVVAERVDPQAHAERIGRLKTRLRDMAYARANHVVVQTRHARRSLAYVPDARITIIPNAVPRASALARPMEPGANGRYRLQTLGRLSPEKGYDVLIAAFATIAGRFPTWDLVLHGEGPHRGALEAVVSRLGLGQRVTLPGATRAGGEVLSDAHILAFPSRYEGFPNALAEGMAAGLPVVTMAGIGGTEELIVDGETGLLASWSDPVVTLADRLAALMADAALRARLGDAARRHVAQFSPELHDDRWEAVLTCVAAQRRGHRRNGPEPAR